MQHHALSIRPFIGAKDFDESSRFYRDLGFEETVLTHNLSVFQTGTIRFYLQDAYVKDWVDNSMLFLEVENLSQYWDDLMALGLTSKYKTIKLQPIREEEWGRVCYIHDPSGILWHVGEFKE